MNNGYHVLGHLILEAWEREAAAPLALAASQAVVERARRDMVLLVRLLDNTVALLDTLVEATVALGDTARRLGDTARRDEDAPGGARALPAATETGSGAKTVVTETALEGEAVGEEELGIWPAFQFATLGDLGKWVYEHWNIRMTNIQRRAGKASIGQMTMREAKAAVERILAERAAAAAHDNKAGKSP